MPRRFYFYGSVFLGLILLMAPGVIDNLASNWARRAGPGLSREGLGHYAYFKRHLREPFKGYTTRQTLLQGFQVVALSNMACGLANVAHLDPSRRAEILPLIEETLRRALSPYVAPFPKFAERPAYWKKQNLYLSHLNMILGAYRVAGGDGRFDVLHARISTFLSEKTLLEPDFHLESFGGGDKWPADQTVTLCSLYLYDRSHGTSLSRKPIDGWLAYMESHLTDPKLQLHGSYLSADPRLRMPRGCALSWSTSYMAHFAPLEARRLYTNYRRHYFIHRWGLGGFREWPPGTNYGMSADTGPVLFGVGFAASGLAIGPARRFGDVEAYSTLMRTGSLFGIPYRWQGRRQYLLSPLLGEAILFNGETATAWFDQESR